MGEVNSRAFEAIEMNSGSSPSSSLKRCHSLDANEHYISKRSVKCHSVLWSIENFSVCLQDEKLESPIFEFGGVRWASHIFPKGMTGEQACQANNYVQVFVKVIQFSSNQTLKFELAIVDKDGNLCFTKKTPPKRLEGANQFGVCFKKFMSHDFLSDTDKYSPNDILTVHHKIILISESETSKIEYSLPRAPSVDNRFCEDWSALLESGQCADFKAFVEVIQFSSNHTLRTEHETSKLQCSLPRAPSVDNRLREDWAALLKFGQCVDFKAFVEVIQFSSNHILRTEPETSKLQCSLPRAPSVDNRLREDWAALLKFGQCVDFNAFFEVIQFSSNQTLKTGPETSKLQCSLPRAPSVDNRLRKDWAALLKFGQCADFKITVDSKEIPTHKAVLVARSPVFRAMLAHPDTAESTSSSMDIDDCKYATFCLFLKYLYTGNLLDTVLDARMAMDLITIANKYDVPGLKSECQYFLESNITVENAAEILIIADMHGCSQDLINASLDFIKINSEAVKAQANWKTLVKQHSHIFIDHFI